MKYLHFEFKLGNITISTKTMAINGTNEPIMRQAWAETVDCLNG